MTRIKALNIFKTELQTRSNKSYPKPPTYWIEKDIKIIEDMTDSEFMKNYEEFEFDINCLNKGE